MDDVLNELLKTAGVSGFEDAVREYIRSRLPPGVSPRVGATGNLVVTVGSGSPSLLLVAHMDEIGFLITGITDDGFLRFQRVGTIDETIVAGTAVTVHSTGGDISGVIGIRPPHLGGGMGVALDSLVIDVGVDTRAEAEAIGVRPLQAASFQRTPCTLGDGKINCRTLDDRFGCYVLLKVCEYAAGQSLSGSVTFVWSVQEEVGLRGARAVLNSLDYDAVIPVDAYATTIEQHGDSSYTPVTLGGGPVLRMFDHGSIASLPFGAWLQELASESRIPLQAGATGGETDGVPLQEAGVHMVPLAVGMRYLHSLAEMASERDIELCVSLLKHVVDQLPDLGRLTGTAGTST